MISAEIERYRMILHEVRPDLTFTQFTYLGAGWDNVLFRIDDGRIVRFATNERTSRTLETEAALLRYLASQLPVPIPVPDFLARAASSPEIALMKYRALPGQSLDEKDLDNDAVTVIAVDLARFLDALHSVDVDATETLEIPRYTPESWVERHLVFYRATRAVVRQGLDPELFERYESWWTDYALSPASRSFTPCLVHGDLVPEHILVEHAPWRLTGIIDFGDAMWADAALDLAGLPERLAQAVVARQRSIKPDQTFWQRRTAYRRIAPLHAILAGLEGGSEELVQTGLDVLVDWLSASDILPQ